jgi:hypothetical protein
MCYRKREKAGKSGKNRHINDYRKHKKPCKSVIYRVNRVPGTGIEPALPCENQILSLTRLPVPPSGHVFGVAILRIRYIPAKIITGYFSGNYNFSRKQAHKA